MTLCVRDIMVKAFDTIHKDAPMETAIQMILNGRVRETGDKTNSLMVVDDYRKLAGVITMFDILYHLRPSFLNYGINGDELAWDSRQLAKCVQDLKDKRVYEIMSTHINGASLDEHLIVILDRMIKNKFHRLPVLENGRPIGVVYMADLYFSLFSKS
ncbi:MAG: CBS domain-containing protein [Pseudomonadota bacterium]